MKLIYLNSYSLVYPEVLKTLNENFQIDQIIYYKKGLNSNTTNKRFLFFKKLLELQLKLINPSISLVLEEIPYNQDLSSPNNFKDYIESLISSKYHSSPQEIMYLIETLEISQMKKQLETLSSSYNFILFTNKHKKSLDVSLEGQNWKKIPISPSDSEKSLSEALKKSYKEQTEARFDHTIRVIEFANQISNWCSLDETTKAKLLLSCAYHDFSKNWSSTKLLNYARKIYSKSRKELESELWCLHGPVAKYYLSRTTKLDNSILTAIEFHTKPIASLDTVGKILVIADKMEPRKKEGFPAGVYDPLLTQLTQGKFEEVFKYLLENPLKS